MSSDDVAVMGMGIEHARAGADGIEVVTPGCRVFLDPGNVLHVEQRIGGPRPLLTCRLHEHHAPWRLARWTPFRCEIAGYGLTITVQGDSVVILAPQHHMRLAFEGRFDPVYTQEVRGQRLMLDAVGGCGFFGFPPRPTPVEVTPRGWRLSTHLARHDELWVSVCPPRERDRERSYQSIAHDCPETPTADHLPEGERYEYVRRFYYDTSRPPDNVIRECARHCQILTVHEGWCADAPDWAEDPPGGGYKHPKPWETDHPVLADPADFAEMRDLVQSLGMKLLPYLSPYYSSAPDLLAEMRRVLEEYGFDGLYFDGWSGIRDDFRPAYRLIREARALLGDRILYLHSSSEPFDTCRVYPPFVFAYADFVLGGEAGRYDLSLDDFLRYVVGQYQISNAVGMWCHYGSMGEPGYHFVVPNSEHIDAALRNHVRLWRQWWSWGKYPEELARFDREYYSKLAALREMSGT